MKRPRRTSVYEDLKRLLNDVGPRRMPRKPKRKGGGSEPVTVEPNRPKLGEGGAAAALEFDE